MKKTVSFEGELFEDSCVFVVLENAFEMSSRIFDARQKIRERLKWDEEITEREAVFLDELSDMLYIEGLE